MCPALSAAVLGAALAGAPAAGQELRILPDGDTVAVRQGEQVVLRYRFRGSGRKPHVLELSAPGGANVLRDAPADHPHHHGLMFACRANGVNFWEEPAGSGRQAHAGWVALCVAPAAGGAPERAVLHERLHWQGADGRTLLAEERLLSLPASGPHEPRVLTWRTTLTAPAGGGPVTLSGAAYHGLGARFLAGMDRGGAFLGAAGGRGVSGTAGRHAAWCAYTAEPRPGKPVTVAVFDAPNNPRHPTRWYTMDRPFAYLSASLGFDTTPRELAAGERLTLHWGVALFDGAADARALDVAYRRWRRGVDE
jgi:Family of unknown function (DUF6807)